MKLFKTTTVVALLAMVLAGCASTEREQRAGTGALIGAAGGALVGQALGRNTTSTVVGPPAGPQEGAAVGNISTPQRGGEEMCRYRAHDGRVYTAPCDDRYYNGRY